MRFKVRVFYAITRGSEMPQKAGCAGNIDGQTKNGQTDGSTPISKAT